MTTTITKTANRLRAFFRNHPRSQSVKITKAEAQAIIESAPLETLGIDSPDETRRITARIVHRLMGKPDEVTAHVEEQLTERYFDQELTRRVETMDRRLAQIAEMADDARRDLRRGRLPDYFTDHSGFDQCMRELRRSTEFVDNTVGGALSYAYLLRNQAAAAAASEGQPAEG